MKKEYSSLANSRINRGRQGYFEEVCFEEGLTGIVKGIGKALMKTLP